MSVLERYNKVFTQTFEVKEEDLPALAYTSIPNWDSVGHMGLIAALEEEFQIMMDMDDIIDFSSYEKGKEILQKYDIKF